MSAMASQINSLTIVYSTVYSGTDEGKHQSHASLAFVRGIHRWPVNSPHKGPVTRKMFPFDDFIMIYTYLTWSSAKLTRLKNAKMMCPIRTFTLSKLIAKTLRPVMGGGGGGGGGGQAEQIDCHDGMSENGTLTFSKTIACYLLHALTVQSHCSWPGTELKWQHFPRYWLFVRGIYRSPVNSPHKDQWRGALMFSLICVWINGWVNNREFGDFRRHRAHYDVIVMDPGEGGIAPLLPHRLGSDFRGGISP